MNRALSKENIKKNLSDAGCNQKQIDTFIQSLDKDTFDQQLLFLKCQRCSLIEKLHDAQKKVDCIDYLIYQLKKVK